MDTPIVVKYSPRLLSLTIAPMIATTRLITYTTQISAGRWREREREREREKEREREGERQRCVDRNNDRHTI